MKITITPLDTLFFKDSQAFGENEGHAAESVFPPPPATVFGAFRGLFYQMYGGNNLPGWFGGPDNPGSLRQEGPLFYSNLSGELLFPLPGDCNFYKETHRLEQLIPTEITTTSVSSNGLTHALYLPGMNRAHKPSGGYYLTASVLQRYLNGEDVGLLADNSFVPIEKIWQTEARTYVGIDSDTNAAMDHRLFALKHVRLQAGFDIVCEWHSAENVTQIEREEIDADIHTAVESGFLKLGGETKHARLKEATSITMPSLPDLTADSTGKTIFWVYFATPAYFEAGSLPEADSDGKRLLKTDENDIPVKILAAAIGKPHSLGGYDVQNRKQRAMERFIPAGSVLICETNEETETLKSLHCATIGDSKMRRAQGYGLALLGTNKFKEHLT